MRREEVAKLARPTKFLLPLALRGGVHLRAIRIVAGRCGRTDPDVDFKFPFSPVFAGTRARKKTQRSGFLFGFSFPQAPRPLRSLETAW